MNYKLFMSIVLIIVGILFTFFNEKMLDIIGRSENGNKWEISNYERKTSMKIGGIGSLFVGSLYLFLQLIKTIFKI
ncbi:hypothetical protein Calab_1058 [Caldithrix abyssi DSM 13497]|uniref:Immunity protein 17 n=1 Tax=Caldithrix abyssi DSM 13497 TaxID=880073 RepID=H1XVW2_CALAY|nr:hypothetical protein [Caldithrix abyssi]EHO40689.1 hypothetical protein Calab_1058 [Caldithrix abyssi DSM 13497]